MIPKIVRLSALLVATCCFATAAGTHYTFFRTGNYPGSFQTFPIALNAKYVVGLYQPMEGSIQGYLEKGKVFKTVLPPGALCSFVGGINGHDAMVGGYSTFRGCGGDNGQHGFMYDHGLFTTIDFPGSGITTSANGVNNLRQVVGGYCVGTPVCPDVPLGPSQFGFLLDRGVFTTLQYPGATGTEPFAINDAGDFAGEYDASSALHAFLFSGGTYQTIDVPGSQYTFALGINNAGMVAGVYEDSQSVTHGFTYLNGAFTRIDVPHATASAVAGIDNFGEITATANLNGLSVPFKGSPRALDAAEPPPN